MDVIYTQQLKPTAQTVKTRDNTTEDGDCIPKLSEAVISALMDKNY